MASYGFHVSEEKSSTLLTLIVDKKDIFATDITKKIHSEITTVVVAAKEQKSHDNVIYVPYSKVIPEIPEGNYSHVFFIWDGKSETLRILEPLLQKAALDKAQFLFITDYHCYSEKIKQFIYQEYASASIVLTGDIFGNEQYESIITKFFNEANATKALQLENVGLRHVYPILFTDVVEQLVKLGFGTQKGKFYLACQRHGMTELSLAHVLQKVDPLIKIDFKKDERQSVYLPEGESLFDVQYDAVRKLQDAYTDLVAGKTSENHGIIRSLLFSPEASQKKIKEHKKKQARWKIFTIVFIFLLLLPILFTVTYAGLGGVILYAAMNAVKIGNYQEASNFSQTAQSLFSIANSSNTITEKELHTFFLENIANALTNAIAEGNLFATLLDDGGKAASNFSLVAKGKSLSPSADFLSGVNAIKSALLTLEASTVTGDVDGISLASIPQRLQPLGSILDIAPAIFGFPQKKTYMILFQNNMELRPGGGFIGSYALASVVQGRVVDFSIHDVYDADGQLKGHIEPPYVIRRYIPEQHWYLRDSNFDVDFSQDAANAAYFLQQETGQKVDGVVGVDLAFVKDVLSGIGPIYVPQYNQTVTADNAFLLVESHAEKNTFAGSTQKKDFLSSLFSAMQTKINTSHGFSPKAILPLITALKSKDIVFGFSDPFLQDVFTVNGLSDSLWDGRKADTATINDTTGINEANIGVNKANYFVTRSVAQNMTIANTGSISGQLSILYTNTSTKGKWPGGPYRNYVRIILPLGAKISNISINEKLQPIVPAITNAAIYEAKGFVAPSGLEVDSAVEEGKQVYGFIVTIPEQASQKIEVSYMLAQKVDISQSTFTYDEWLIKQPGVSGYPYYFSLTVPSVFSVLQKPSSITTSGNTSSFTKTFDMDMPFSITFTKK